MTGIIKQAFDAGAYQALADFGLTKTAAGVDAAGIPMDPANAALGWASRQAQGPGPVQGPPLAGRGPAPYNPKVKPAGSNTFYQAQGPWADDSPLAAPVAPTAQGPRVTNRLASPPAQGPRVTNRLASPPAREQAQAPTAAPQVTNRRATPGDQHFNTYSGMAQAFNTSHRDQRVSGQQLAQMFGNRMLHPGTTVDMSQVANAVAAKGNPAQLSGAIAGAGRAGSASPMFAQQQAAQAAQVAAAKAAKTAPAPQAAVPAPAAPAPQAAAPKGKKG